MGLDAGWVQGGVGSIKHRSPQCQQRSFVLVSPTKQVIAVLVCEPCQEARMMLLSGVHGPPPGKHSTPAASGQGGSGVLAGVGAEHFIDYIRPQQQAATDGVANVAWVHTAAWHEQRPEEAQPAKRMRQGLTAAAAVVNATTAKPLSQHNLVDVMPAQLGVRLLWVAPHIRRQGLGSQILDVAR